MAKAKTKQKARPVNFNHAKTMQTIRYLQLSENQMSRKDLLSLSGKDIFYALKNNGYIRESSKGVYQGTDKLHSYMKKQDGSTFSKSNSHEHSNKVCNSLHLLPQQVITAGRFQTGTDLHQEYQKYKQQSNYQLALRQEKESLQDRMRELGILHQDFLKSEKSEAEKLQEDINYRVFQDNLERSYRLLQEENFSTPDYAVHLTEEEGKAYLEGLCEYRDSLTEQKEYELYSRAIEKLESILVGGDIILGVEIITNSYGSVDLEKHQVYERITNQNVIYLT